MEVFIEWGGGKVARPSPPLEFLMDRLKTKAPFWKKEEGPDGSRRVEAKSEDDERTERWVDGC